MRDRLIELIAKSNLVLVDGGIHPDTHKAQEALADYLLANGVIVPPCKVGDTVYKVCDIGSVHRNILEMEVLRIEMGSTSRICLKTTKKHLFNFEQARFEDFGKTVFLTEEEAKAALERSKE